MGKRQDNRQAGIGFLKINGRSFEIMGKLNAQTYGKSREAKVGSAGVTGYKESAVVPYIDCTIALPPDVDLEDIESVTNATVVAEAANGWDHGLRNAWCTAAVESDLIEGEADVRFEGKQGYRLAPAE